MTGNYIHDDVFDNEGINVAIDSRRAMWRQ